jgi:predicted transcriptional regulator
MSIYLIPITWRDGTMSEENTRTIKGPLYAIFGSPTALVVDQVRIVGNMEQTISTLGELTDLSYKTVQKVVDQLISQGLMEPARKLGNAQSYRFKTESLQNLIKWADETINKQLEEPRVTIAEPIMTPLKGLVQ